MDRAVVLHDPSRQITPGMTVNDEYFDGGNPLTNPGWEDAFGAFANYGIPRDPMRLEDVEFDSNQPITHTYTVFPWKDNTHKQIQEYMLTFVTRYMDPEYHMVNMSTIYRFNIEMTEQWIHFTNPRSTILRKTEFEQGLQRYGEQGLEMYRTHPFVDSTVEEMKSFYDVAHEEQFVYLTKQGILSKWNFCGAVASKQQSSAPNDDMDFPDTTESVNVIGVNIAGESRIHNLWGDVKPGDKLFLVLTRKKLRNGNYGPFQWISWYGKGGDRPSFFYTDERDQEQKAYVLYIGLCTRVTNDSGGSPPSEKQIASALGHYNVIQDAYESYASLPCIVVQIGI